MPDDEGLREELAAAIWDAVDGYISGVPWERARQNVFQEAKALRRADAVLAVPAVAEALAAVERVRALAEEFDAYAANPGWYGQHYHALSIRLRCALDGGEA